MKRRKNLLIADGNKAIVDMLVATALAKKVRYDIFEARTGKQAHDILTGTRMDAAIFGGRMDGGTLYRGPDLANLAAHMLPMGKRLPYDRIAIYTGAMGEHIPKLIGLGLHGKIRIFEKPFQSEEMISYVTRL